MSLKIDISVRVWRRPLGTGSVALDVAMVVEEGGGGGGDRAYGLK